MKNWKGILKILRELEILKDFYSRSLLRVSQDCTEENYTVFVADSKALNDAERELYRLSKEAN